MFDIYILIIFFENALYIFPYIFLMFYIFYFLKNCFIFNFQNCFIFLKFLKLFYTVLQIFNFLKLFCIFEGLCKKLINAESIFRWHGAPSTTNLAEIIYFNFRHIL